MVMSVMRNAVLASFSRQLIAQKEASPNGRVPYGAMAKIVRENKEDFPWLNENLLRCRVYRKNLSKGATLPPTRMSSRSRRIVETELLSTRTDNNTNNVNQESDHTPPLPPPLETAGTNVEPSSPAGSSSSSTCSSLTLPTLPVVLPEAEPGGSEDLTASLSSDAVMQPTSSGRPKGTTSKSIRKAKLAKMHLTDVCTERVYNARRLSKTLKLKNGEVQKIINSVKIELNLPDIQVKPATIYKRLKRGCIHGSIPGPKSPSLALDGPLLELILALADMRQCITAAQGLLLANSLIKGEEIEDEIRKFKLEMKYNTDMNGKNKDGALLGDAYWRSFLARNRDRLVSKKGRKFAVSRDQWCIWTNFADMYDNVYEAMTEAKVAEKLETPAFMDKKGNIVDNEKDAYGRKCTHKLIEPSMCLVADETGANTAMKGDGHVGGRRFLGRAGDSPSIRSSDVDNHFTSLCFTALTGEPVCCVIVFKGEFQYFQCMNK